MKRKLSLISLVFLASFAFFIIFFAPPAEAVEIFNTDLRFGMTHSQVKMLQVVLNTDPATTVATAGSGSKGNETDYFGSLTLSAVIKFQEKYSAEILVPAGLSSGSGFVGAFTRKKLNTFIKIKPATTTTTTTTTSTASGAASAVTITSIMPSPFPDGGFLSIIGTGFTASNTVMLSAAPKYKYNSIPSSFSGTQISLTVSTGIGDNINANLAKIDSTIREAVIQKLVDRFRHANGQATTSARSLLVPVTVMITNENGTSNSQQIMLDMLKN